MATYTRNSSYNSNNSQLPMTSMPNQELASVIVRTLVNTIGSENSSGGERNITPKKQKDKENKELEKTITKAIDKSKLGKNGVGGTIGKGSESDKKLAEYYEQEKLIKYQEFLDRQSDRLAKEQERREKKLHESIDNAFKGLNEWSSNPLKGMGDLLDKGVKGLVYKVSGFFGSTPQSGGSEITARNGSEKSTVAKLMDSTSLGRKANTAVSMNASVGDINARRLADKEGIAYNKPLSEEIAEGLLKSKGEKTEDEKKSEKTDKDTKEALLKETTKNSGASVAIKAQLAKWGLIIGGVILLFPILVGAITNFFARVPLWFNELKLQVGALISGPNNIGVMVKNAIKIALPNFTQNKLTEEQNARLNYLVGKSAQMNSAKENVKGSLTDFDLTPQQIEYYTSSAEGFDQLQKDLENRTIKVKSTAKGKHYKIRDRAIQYVKNQESYFKKAQMTDAELAEQQELWALKRGDPFADAENARKANEAYIDNQRARMISDKAREGKLSEWDARYYEKNYGTSYTKAVQISGGKLNTSENSFIESTADRANAYMGSWVDLGKTVGRATYGGMEDTRNNPYNVNSQQVTINNNGNNNKSALNSY